MTTIGVLAIGSLYWGNGCRRRWRDERLDCGKQECVKVPIRYGRRSSTWGDAYTMVVWPTPRAEEWGTAIAVPFKSDNLVEEAERLWGVEAPTAIKGSISAKHHWGRVALLENPDRRLPEKLLEAWTCRIQREEERGGYRLPNYGDGEFEDLVDLKCGRLKIDWPSTTAGPPLGWNALLVAVTDPKGPERDCCRYPSSQEIAKAWKTKKAQVRKNGPAACYFWMNQQHGITTFQDAAIKEYLKQPDA